MAKANLVIVESPAKAKTIGKYLGPTYQVLASMGHVRDLPKSKMGVDLELSLIHIFQQDDGGILQKGPGDGDALAFPAGELGSVLPDGGVIALSPIHI